MAERPNKESGKSLGGVLSNLSDRERKGLYALAGFLPLMGLIVAILAFNNSMTEIEADTRTYSAALDLIAAAGPAYSEAAASRDSQGSHKDISDETLSNNDIKLTSFVAEHASATNINVTSYDEDELPFGDKEDGGPLTVEKQLRVEIRKSQMSDLVQLLERIEKSEEPVFIKRIDIRKQRRTPGMVRAVLTVSTFVRKEQES